MLSTHALNLPEILVLIAPHLDTPDLASACRVTRTWFIPFASRLWSRITSRQYSYFSLRSSIPRYATCIKYLDCDTHGLTYDYDSLDTLVLPCPGLTHLVSLNAPPVFASNVAQVRKLFEQNQHGLQTVEVLWGNPDFTDSMLTTLTLLNKLTTLAITTHWIPTGTIESLLDKLPYLTYLKVEELNASRWNLARDATGEASLLANVRPWQPLRTTLRLQSLLLHLSALVPHPFLEIVQASPDLELLDIFSGRSQNPMMSIKPAKNHALALALHRSCLKFQHLMVGGDWVDERALYQLLGLVDTFEDLNIGPTMETRPIRPQWLALKTLHLRLDSMSCGTQAKIVVEGGEVLRDVMEELTLTSILRDGAEGAEGSGAIAMILFTFTKLTSFHTSLAVVQVEELLERVLVEVEGVKERSPIQNFKKWACRNLRHLKISIEGDESWCPSVAVDGRDYNRRERERKRTLGETYRVDPRYPLYYDFQTFLGGMPRLDQRNIKYQYQWNGYTYRWRNN